VHLCYPVLGGVISLFSHAHKLPQASLIQRVIANCPNVWQAIVFDNFSAWKS